MVTVSIISTRKAEDKTIITNEEGPSLQLMSKKGDKNLTYGKGRLEALTVTGTIYEASDYKIRVENEYGLLEVVDLSDQLYGITCSASISSRLSQSVKEATAEYFWQKECDNIFEIKVGLKFQARKVSLIDGFHPTLKIKTKTFYINDPQFLGVEEPEEVVLDGQQLVAAAKQARMNTQERSEASLLSKLKQKGGDAINSLLGKPTVTK